MSTKLALAGRLENALYLGYPLAGASPVRFQIRKHHTEPFMMIPMAIPGTPYRSTISRIASATTFSTLEFSSSAEWLRGCVAARRGSRTATVRTEIAPQSHGRVSVLMTDFTGLISFLTGHERGRGL
jgi:hypothetical protein